MSQFRKLLLSVALALITVSAFAQHSLQVDDGAGGIGILSATGLNPGITTFTFPASGGTILTTGTGPTSAWLLAGNALLDVGASPTQWLGTSTNDDVVMKANGIEKLRLVSGGGLVASGRIVIVDQNELRINDADNSNFVGFGTPSDVTTSYTLTFPDAPPSTNGQVLSSTTGGVLSWTTPSTGDVAGPASAQDNAVTRFDGTTGKLIQNSALIVEDYSTSTQNKTVLRADDGATADISLVLSPKGAGAIIADNPDGAASGGNARGTNAVDLQMSRTITTQVASGIYSVISGGKDNRANGQYATIGGGTANIASGDGAVVAGGGWSGPFANGNTASGLASSITGGTGNIASGIASVVAGGATNAALNDYATAVGGTSSLASGAYATVVGGSHNTASGQLSFIGGGYLNEVSGGASVIGGGYADTIRGDYSAIPGGNGMILDASADGSFGFLGNNPTLANNMIISAANTAVFGNTDLWLANNDNAASELRFYEAESGVGAFPSGTKYVAFKSPAALTSTQTYELPLDYPSVSGYVLSSTTVGALSWVTAGGLANFTDAINTSAPNATVPVASLTATNAATDVDAAFIPKGAGAILADIPDNLASGGNKRGTNAVDLQMARGIASQVASGDYSVITGGIYNTAGGYAAAISGGRDHTANGDYSTIGGGLTNVASGYAATISGGAGSTASNDYATVSGGRGNTATANFATVSGGDGNNAQGVHSAIAGGEGLTLNASAARSFGFLGGYVGPSDDMTISAPNTAVFGNTNLWLANNDNTARELRFYDAYNASGAFPNTAKHVAFKAPAALTNTQTYELPLDYPSVSGYVLSSTTGGVLSWVSTGGSFINNQTSQQTSANFNIDGTGTASTFVASTMRGLDGTSGSILFIRGGNGSSTTGGALSLVGGNATSGAAGNAAMAGGNSSSGVGGNASISAGLSSGTANGAGVFVSATNAAGTGNGGSVTISAGSGATSGNGGNITLTPGDLAGAGTSGYVAVANGKQLRIYEPGTTNYNSLQTGTQSVDINYTLPTTAPVVNQVLTAIAVSGGDVTLGWSDYKLFELEDDSVTNDDDALYDCDNLQAPLAASSNYSIDAFLYYRTDGHDGTDIRMAFTYSGTLATDGMHLSGRGAGEAESEEDIWTTSGTSTVTNVNQDLDAYIHIVGFVRTSTAGTLKVQFANGTEGSGRVTILKGGSYMKVTKF